MPKYLIADYLLRMQDFLDTYEGYIAPTYQAVAKLLVAAEDENGERRFPFHEQQLKTHPFVKSYVQGLRDADAVCKEDAAGIDVKPERAIHAFPKAQRFEKIPNSETEFVETESGATFKGTFVVDPNTTIEDYIAANVDLSKYQVIKTGKKTFQGFMKDEVTMQPVIVTMCSIFVDLKPLTQEIDLQQLREADIAFMKQYAPVYHTLKREKLTDGHLLILDPADTHFGKYSVAEETGEPYNLSLAESRTKEGVAGILQKANGYPLDKVVLFLGNDMLHTENGKGTTKGTPQDTDGMWYEAYQVAKRTQIEIIEGLILHTDVHLSFNPSNHDYRAGYMLFDAIATHFHKAKNVTVDGTMAHYKYMMYGNSLIGTSHGDGVKQSKLAEVMAYEAKSRWADALFYHFYTAHQHHMKALDIMGVSVEGVRSISAPDSYHAMNAYKGPMSMTGFIHSKEFGQATRITHNFKPYNPQGMPVFELTPGK